MLCAVWELYCEDVLVEAVQKVTDVISKPDRLPQSVQKQLIQAVHHENVWKSDPLRLAGKGWKKEYLKIANAACRRFNTPKPEMLLGQSRQIKLMSRIAPAFLFRQFAKTEFH